jgi:AraC family transcriptional regulator of adaptative response/methylated-DNA-[protein]-cysteine methyltransferase
MSLEILVPSSQWFTLRPVRLTSQRMAKHSVPLQFDSAEQARFDARFTAAVSAVREEGATPLAIQWVVSPVGPLLIGATSDALMLLEFSDHDQLDVQLARIRKHFGRALMRADNPVLERLRGQLAEYFAGARRDFQLPLEFHGSEFQERVWSALQRIPYGETCSYGAIAKSLGDANAMRAVGAANGLNPIAIVIPCHRVVNANGELGGYGGGLWRKRILLDLERGQGNLF